MTHDATIIFGDKADADRAVELLDRCSLSDGHKTFFVERQAPDRVFYQLAFEHKVDPETTIVCGNYSQPFFDVFQSVCERTGAHVPEGDIFCEGISIPGRIYNHEFFGYLLGHFRASSLKASGQRIDSTRALTRAAIIARRVWRHDVLIHVRENPFIHHYEAGAGDDEQNDRKHPC